MRILRIVFISFFLINRMILRQYHHTVVSGLAKDQHFPDKQPNYFVTSRDVTLNMPLLPSRDATTMLASTCGVNPA